MCRIVKGKVERCRFETLEYATTHSPRQVSYLGVCFNEHNGGEICGRVDVEEGKRLPNWLSKNQHRLSYLSSPTHPNIKRLMSENDIVPFDARPEAPTETSSKWL